MTPLFDSLESAAKALVRDPEYNRREMHLHHWATTYRCSIDDVNQALDIAENGRRKTARGSCRRSSPMHPDR
jgi:hypothetical protein